MPFAPLCLNSGHALTAHATNCADIARPSRPAVQLHACSATMKTCDHHRRPRSVAMCEAGDRSAAGEAGPYSYTITCMHACMSPSRRPIGLHGYIHVLSSLVYALRRYEAGLAYAITTYLSEWLGVGHVFQEGIFSSLD